MRSERRKENTTTEKSKPEVSFGSFNLSSGTRRLITSLAPSTSPFGQKEYEELAYSSGLHYDGDSFWSSFVEDWGHRNYNAYLYTPLSLNWYLHDLSETEAIFLHQLRVRDSAGYEEDTNGMLRALRRSVSEKLRREIVQLPIKLVRIPPPPWDTSSPPFWCLESETGQLIYPYIHTLLERTGFKGRVL